MDTKRLLTEHYKAYPKMQIEDVFKYLFQSSFGCEHLISDADAVLSYIKREYETVHKTAPALVEPLDCDFSRVHLSSLNGGLTPETLARLFFLSAKAIPDGREKLIEKLAVARELIKDGTLPLDIDLFDREHAAWRDMNYPAVRHSAIFRESYHPAYRVISNRFSEYLPIFSEIDKRLKNGPLVIAIEGGSASGKTTLAEMLSDIYGASVIHMDDFFLPPEKRTPERLSTVGGNIDSERFYDEVIIPLSKGEAVSYRPFDCSTGSLGEPITVAQSKLTVVEGVYSMHESFGEYYGLAVFLDIDEALQRERIKKRNTPAFAKRFFEEWIPLENAYFNKTGVKKRSLCLTAEKK